MQVSHAMVEDARLKEYRTDPDLVELAEEIAEDLRFALMDADGVGDRLEECMTRLAPEEVQAAICGDMEQEAQVVVYDAEFAVAMTALRQVLAPMVAMVVAQGHWKES